MWSILRRRASKTGWLPKRMFKILQKFCNSNKPYFIAKNNEGISFVGDFRDYYAAQCAVVPEYDTVLIRFLEEKLKSSEGDYLDVGTNTGVVASTIARYLQGRSEVIGFEPVLETARRAGATFALNNLTNMRFFPMAVSDSDEDITFFDSPGHSEWASVNPTDQGDVISWRKTVVPSCRLDTLARSNRLSRVALMKIDVEGHEPQVVRGASELIARDKPAIIYEYHYNIAPQLGVTTSTVADLISLSGAYRYQVFDELKGLLPFPPSSEGIGPVNIFAEYGS